MQSLRRDPRILALDPYRRGFGYVVLEGPGLLVDWGLRQAETLDQEPIVRAFRFIMELYKPEVLVFEDWNAPGWRHSRRVHDLLTTIGNQALAFGVRVERISRLAVREVFAGAGARNKDDIARTVAEHFPELKPKVPPRRKLWMSEDSRMATFDAAALGLAFYYRC